MRARASASGTLEVPVRARVGWQEGVTRFLAYNTRLIELLDEGMKLRGAEADTGLSAELVEGLAFLKFLADELRDVETRWRASRDG